MLISVMQHNNSSRCPARDLSLTEGDFGDKLLQAFLHHLWVHPGGLFTELNCLAGTKDGLSSNTVAFTQYMAVLNHPQHIEDHLALHLDVPTPFEVDSNTKPTQQQLELAITSMDWGAYQNGEAHKKLVVLSCYEAFCKLHHYCYFDMAFK
ncbi:hypothetical protein DSO57_1030406 [Entomophthora muscae]|uniref:Uncharacterized protein n=1 Tax=Entomophthora muscae TaxID=34485 RepID=A0ACC2RRZ5_9FUNG|nr:hypothetical protein DSO57_1030406 [Entomophthora muscae]